MDIAYDHIQEELLAPEHDESQKTSTDKDNKNDEATGGQPSTAGQTGSSDLGAEFQETFRAFQQNPWGQKLGGFWDNVRQKGESVYKEATKEYNAASEEAAKGLSGWKETLVRQTRGLSLGGGASSSEPKQEDGTEKLPETTRDMEEKSEDQKTADGANFLSKFKEEAAKKLKDIQKAEDAADEALARWRSNVASFFKDAISVTGPEGSDASGNVLFESRDGTGKRVIHTSRLEAQLHVIHANPDRMMKDPESQAWAQWANDFKIDEKTDDIARDLEAYPELRKAMEQLVPEKVQYPDFWRRYYFLRHIVETEEQRRKEILKDVSNEEEEEVDWDNDSDEEDVTPPTTATKSAAPATQDKGKDAEDKPKSPRPSNEQSLPDSDASYDIVSGAATATSGTPKGSQTPIQTKTAPATTKVSKAEEESSDDDWE
ncbi:hypothetical protein KEM56_005362 [Ascosphaera pollenicola]|nr:hypothetical protein KEM56_005362 [Ascosphaera pollenicola]